MDKKLQRAFVASVRRYYGREQVQGIAIGIPYKKGVAARGHAVRVHVTEKVPLALLDTTQLLRTPIAGVRLDVTEGTYVDHVCATFSQRVMRSSLVQPGLSIGAHDGAGTLGALVESAKQVRFILTAGHVLFSARSNYGDAVYQPARDDGSPQKIGFLAAYLRTHDAALAQISSGRKLKPQPLEAAGRFSAPVPPLIGQVLRKSGRSTCCTRAKVDAIGPFGSLVRAVWLRPIDGEPDDARICEEGDSGAIWYDEKTMAAVCMHLKGDTVFGSRAIGVQLASDADAHYVGVLDRLRVRIL